MPSMKEGIPMCASKLLLNAIHCAAVVSAALMAGGFLTVLLAPFVVTI